MFKSFFHFLRSRQALLAQVALVVIFVGVLAWGASIPATQADEAEVPVSTTVASQQITSAVTHTPVESTPNQNETQGIIFAGILLVLIIVVGTLGVINSGVDSRP